MDKGCNKKIRSYIFLWIVLMSFSALLLILIRLNLAKSYDLQRQEFSAMFREQETLFNESFSYYEKEEAKEYYIFFAIFTAAASALMIGSYLYEQQRDRRELERKDENLSNLLECLESFQKGDCDISKLAAYSDGVTFDNEVWDEIWKRLKALGIYFSDQREKLSEEENSTKTLISDISHQLKTPLASLRMSHELVSTTGLTDAEKEEFLEQEEIELKRLELLLQELVNLSRLENHMIKVNQIKSGIRKTITEAVNIVVLKALKKNIELQVSLEDDIVVYHDTKWTVEALANVLDNAIKYSNENSKVELRVSTLPNMLIIEIEDSGIGISESELHNIFKRFYRGRRANAFSKDGAGIGLYLTKGIIEQQSGTIVAKRKLQGGTIIRITLPL